MTCDDCKHSVTMEDKAKVKCECSVPMWVPDWVYSTHNLARFPGPWPREMKASASASGCPCFDRKEATR